VSFPYISQKKPKNNKKKTPTIWEAKQTWISHTEIISRQMKIFKHQEKIHGTLFIWGLLGYSSINPLLVENSVS
jgi:hypothetical protein